jgi:hypothetical protein
MPSTITIIHTNKPSQCDLAFGKIANFLGIDSVFLSIDEYITQVSSSGSSENSGILTLGCDTLAGIYEDKNTCENIIASIKNNSSYLYVYGISPGSANANALRDLTGGMVRHIISHTNGEARYEVSSDNSEITRHFTGLSIGGINKETDFGLEVPESTNNIARLITINSRPLFLTINQSPCSIFLQATSQILDIDQPASGVDDTDIYFSQLIPPMMFLKYVFKDGCWHSEVQYASVIIDDPLLRKNYGFVNYDSLLDEMERHNFFINIAFIPWNYRRTDKNIADMFRKKSNRFAIGIHGYEHTKGELGITNPEEIDQIVKLSLKRMRSHEENYGIPFDRVMTFPQGIFSAEAMKVLKSNNYLAGFNFDFTCAGQSVDIKIRDILEPAIMNYYAFPLFIRGYPGEIASFASDLFLGKPALIITHHHDYQKTEIITGLVDKINALNGSLKWISLGGIAKSTHLIKRIDEDEYQIRLYSPVTTIRNNSERAATYQVLKKEDPEVEIKQVNIDGNETPYKLKDNDLCIDVRIPPKSSINVEIIYKELYSYTGKTPGTLKKIRVAVRRILSEIRDNYVDTQPILASLYRKIRKPARKHFNSIT